MIDLSQLPEELRLARGDYATVRAAHEDAKKSLALMCGELQSITVQILRRMQPDNEAVPDSVEELLMAARNCLNKMELCSDTIESLARQRAELKIKAWK